MNSHAIIHVALKQLGMDEDTARDLYAQATGKRSLRAMDEAERQAVVEALKRVGFTARPKTAGRRKASAKKWVRLIFALWRSIGEKGGLDDPSPAGLAAFVQKRTGVSDPEWLTYAQADPLIRALKAMEARAGAAPEAETAS